MPRDYEDDDRPRRRRSRRDEDDDRPARRPARELSVLGLISLIGGIGALIVGIMPCVGSFAFVPGLVALTLGVIGLVIASRSNGRQGKGLSIAGISTASGALVLSLVWFLIIGRMTSKLDEMAEEGRQQSAVRAKEADEKARKAAAEMAEAKAIPITAVELDRVYEEDKAVADRKYKNQVLEVTGRVARVVPETLPRITIELRADNQGSVDCDFRADPGGRATQLKPGDHVTIKGRCIGRIGAWVHLEDCVVAATPHKAAPAATGGDVIRVTATQLARDYEADEAQADRKYKGKVLEVTGTVADARFDVDEDFQSLLLKAFEKGLVDVWVDCRFPNDPATKARLGRLKAGDRVTIRGKCTGHTTLEGCELVN